MSDEYQPNDVVESQPESEAMPAEPVMAEPDEATTAPQVASTDATQVEAVIGDPEAATQAVSDPSAEAAAVTADLPSAEVAATDTAREPVIPGSVVVGDTAETAVAAPAPRVVSIADLEAQPALTPADRPARAGIVSLLAGRGWIVAAAAAVLVTVFLFLPPISLAQRIGMSGGYTVLDRETTTVEHPDGLRVSRPADAEGKLRVKLGSVPRADIVSGAAPDDLVFALDALPASLTLKSPYYTIDLKSNDPVAGQLQVLIPNEAEPWETLDLYAWDADSETWMWLPTKLDRTAEVLVSDVDQLPASVLVVQTESATPRVVASLESWPAVDVAAAGVDEVDVSGILIGTMGGITGYADQLPAATAGGTVALAPTVRNWVLDRPENWALVSDMLTVDPDRTAHVANLLSLTQAGGYPGLVVDYRSVQPQDRDLFSQFVGELGGAFHEQGLWVAVVVGTPQLGADGTWNTGGYDWAALGTAVDQLRVLMPLTPTAYEPGGEAEQLVQWAVTHVARYKLMAVYSTLSTDGQVTVGMDTVLGSLGEVSVMQTVTESVIPGSSLSLTLGQVGLLEDPATQATSVVFGEETYWLGTPPWLRTRMDLVSRYRLGGVVLRDLLDEGNMAGMLSAVADFKAAGVGTAGPMPEVVWSVTDPAGQTTQASAQFTQPGYTWTAPTVTGTYSIAATVSGVDKGSVDVLVAAPAPVVTDTIAVDEDEEPASTPDEEGLGGGAVVEEADGTLKAGFVADVSVPDNTQFEKGESFTKTWRMKNTGTTGWPEDTVFVFAGDTQLGDVTEVEVGAVASGETVDISVEMVAPDEDGTYKSTWALRTGGKNIDGGEAYVQIRIGEPAVAQPSAPSVSAPVATGAFELGGHIRDIGLPYKDTMKYAGMTWIKTQIFYGQDAHGMVAAAHNNGFKIQLSAIGGADMVTQDGFEDKFAAWVGQLAAAGADAIEVWNEPNIDREWKVGLISPASYTSLLCKSYSAIKSANAGSAVISAAPAPTGWFGGCGPNGCDDQPWMEGLYNAGAANCMDYIGAHHNAGATSPSAAIGHPANPGDTHHSWFFLPQTQLYYNVFRGTRQIFYTEMGYASQDGVPTFSDQFAWARGIDNSEQAAWLAEAVQLSINTGMVRNIIVWNIDFVRYGYDPQDGYAIIRPGGGCPACETLHNVLGSR